MGVHNYCVCIIICKLLRVYLSQCLPLIGRTTLYLVNGLTINYRHMNTIICHDSSISHQELVPIVLRISVCY